MAKSPKIYQFALGLVASLGSLLLGYDLGVIAAVVASPSFHSHFGDPSATEVGVVVSMFTAGAFFGAFLGGPTADYLGRRWTMICGAMIFNLGGSLQTAGVAIAYMYSGRFIAG